MIRVGGIFGRGCPGGRLAGILVPSGWLPVCDQIRRVLWKDEDSEEDDNE